MAVIEPQALAPQLATACQLLFWTFLDLLCIPLIKCMVPLWEQTKWNTQWINETKCIKMRWELPIYSASFVYVGGIAKQNRREQDLTAWRSCPGQATLGSWVGCKIAQYPPWMQTSQPLPLHLKLGIVGSCFKPHMVHVYQYSAYLIYKYLEIQVVWYKLAISHQGNYVPLYKIIYIVITIIYYHYLSLWNCDDESIVLMAGQHLCLIASDATNCPVPSHQGLQLRLTSWCKFLQFFVSADRNTWKLWTKHDLD